MKKIKPMNKRMKIYYSPTAFSKTVRLITAHDKEIGWNMVIKPYNDGYKVYDILVYPQRASAAYLDIDTAKYGIWKASLSEEEDANLFGQGHSHVNMGVTPSPTDEKQQLTEVLNKGEGFFFFQIWNKRLEVNSFFYDIDNDLLYEKNDIDLIIEDDGFIANSKAMLTNEEPQYPKELMELLEGDYKEDESV